MKIEFDNTGSDFSGLEKAQKWCEKNNYSYGQMQGSSPIGIAKGDVYIGKWRHIAIDEFDLLSGIIDGNFRNGKVTIKIGEVKSNGDVEEIKN